MHNVADGREENYVAVIFGVDLEQCSVKIPAFFTFPRVSFFGR